MLKDIIKETESAIDAAYKEMYEKYYIPFVLLIGRADIMPGLNRHYHTDCVIDYQLDRYYDETREGFYLRYLNRNYHKEGFHYQGDDGIDDFNRSFSNKNECVTLQAKYEDGRKNNKRDIAKR